MSKKWSKFLLALAGIGAAIGILKMKILIWIVT